MTGNVPSVDSSNMLIGQILVPHWIRLDLYEPEDTQSEPGIGEEPLKTKIINEALAKKSGEEVSMIPQKQEKICGGGRRDQGVVRIKRARMDVAKGMGQTKARGWSRCDRTKILHNTSETSFTLCGKSQLDLSIVTSSGSKYGKPTVTAKNVERVGLGCCCSSAPCFAQRRSTAKITRSGKTQ